MIEKIATVAVKGDIFEREKKEAKKTASKIA